MMVYMMCQSSDAARAADVGSESIEGPSQEKDLHEEDEEEGGEDTEVGGRRGVESQPGRASRPLPPVRLRGLSCSLSGRPPPLGPH